MNHQTQINSLPVEKQKERKEQNVEVDKAQHRTGVLLMVGASISFTINVLLIRSLGESANTWIVSSIRFAVGFAVTCLLFLPNQKLKLTHLFTSRDLILRGILGSIGVFLFYVTIPALGAGKATFLNTTYIVIATVVAAVWLGEKMRIYSIALTLMTLVGMFLLTGVGSGVWVFDLYFAAAIGSAILSAIVVVYIRKLTRTEHSSTIFASQCVFGLVIGIGPAMWSSVQFDGVTLFYLVVCGVFAAGGQLMMTYGFRYLTVNEGGVLGMLAPVLIMIGGSICFGESYAVLELVGAVLILLCCTLMGIRRPLNKKV